MRLSALVVSVCVLAPAGAAGSDEAGGRHANDRFGSALALDGDRLAVAAAESNAGGFDAGIVHVYVHDGGEWRLEAQLHNPGDAPARTHFGRSVALAGATLAVGATIEDGWAGRSDERRGAVHVYTRRRDRWRLQTSLGDSDSDSDSFGRAVALVGDTLVVASDQRVRARAVLPSRVEVFRRADATWEAEASIELPELRFGDLGLGDGTLLVTSGGDLSAFRREGASWSADPSLIVGPGGLDGFVVDGDTALLLHRGDAPRVTVYRDSDGAWSLAGEFVVPEGAEWVGRPALAGDQATVGVVDGLGRRQVALWRQDDSWRLFDAVDAPAELEEGALFGEVLAVDSRWLVIGVPQAGDTPLEQSGRVLVHANVDGLPEVARLSPEDALAGCGCRAGGGPLNLLAGLFVLGRRRRTR